MGRLDFPEAAHERVVIGIGDFGLVEDVIEMLVAAQFVAESLDLGLECFAHVKGGLYNRTEGVVLNARYDRGIFLYNPTAGQIRSRPAMVYEAYDVLQRLAGSLTVVATEGPGTAGRQAAEAVAAGADLVLVAGGDGTVNEALQGLVGTHAALGIIPAGTANVTSMEIGLGKRNRTALPGLLRAEPVRIAVGAMTVGERPKRYFLAMAGVGLDASIVRRVSPGFKKRFGKLSYGMRGSRRWGRRCRSFRPRWTASGCGRVSRF